MKTETTNAPAVTVTETLADGTPVDAQVETTATAEDNAKAEADEKARNEAVSDEAIMIAMINAANRKDENGKVIGHLGEVAEETGMNIGSLNGRLTNLRKMGCVFDKLARTPSTGITRKKDPKKVLSLLESLRAKMSESAGETPDDSQDEAVDATGEAVDTETTEATE